MNVESVFVLLAIGGVVSLLAALWRKRRIGGGSRRLELLDRVALTHQHSVCLLAVEGRWMAVAVTPRGVELLDSGPFASHVAAQVAGPCAAQEGELAGPLASAVFGPMLLEKAGPGRARQVDRIWSRGRGCGE